MKYDNGIFSEDYRISFTYTGFHNMLTNKSFLLLMENLASEHSNYFGMSFEELAKDNLTWAILNWKLKVFKRPKEDEIVTIKTWIRSVNHVLVYRDFKVFNQSNELLAIASSKWCLINTIDHRLEKMPADIESRFKQFHNESVFQIDDLPKIIVPDVEVSNIEISHIRRFDLDINKHVHNLNYLNYAYEVLPEEVYFESQFDNVEIYYKKELVLGQTIKTMLYLDNDNYTVVIKNHDESVTHCILKLFN